MIKELFGGLNEKGVSPVIAIVLLLMMTVAAAGAAYFWLTSMQSSMQESSRKSIENIMQQSGRRLLAQATICKPVEITNGGFSKEGWTGWTTSPLPEGGTAEFWIDDWPDDGDCVTPSSGDNDGLCSYAAASDEIFVTDSPASNAVCGPVTGCPTSVLGDYDLDGDNSYNGHIISDSVRVPEGEGSIYIHWWHNLQGRSSDGGRYDGSTRFYGLPKKYSMTESEGVGWALILDGDCDNDIDGDDEIVGYQSWGQDNGYDSPDIKENKTIEVTDYRGQCLRVYIVNHHAGGGDYGFIQIDDLYWSDESGSKTSFMAVKVTVRNIGSVKIPEAEFVANLKKDGTTVDSDTYTTSSSIDTGDLKTLTFYFNEMRLGGKYNINIPGIDVSQSVKCQSLE